MTCTLRCTAGPIPLSGRFRTRDLKTFAPDAPKILLHNVHGWFARVERGVYGLTEAGWEAMRQWPAASWAPHAPYSVSPMS